MGAGLLWSVIMVRIGLTGGIGMGKSTAGSILADQGLPLIDSDAIARQLVEPGQPALAEIQTAFGPQVLTPARELDRAALAARVFVSDEERHLLESILHPRIRQSWRLALDQYAAQGAGAAVVVIPLLFEIGVEKEFEATVSVACSQATQTSRLEKRGWSREQIHRRIESQLPVTLKVEKADYVLWNESSPAVLAAQIERVLRSLGRF